MRKTRVETLETRKLVNYGISYSEVRKASIAGNFCKLFRNEKIIT